MYFAVAQVLVHELIRDVVQRFMREVLDRFGNCLEEPKELVTYLIPQIYQLVTCHGAKDSASSSLDWAATIIIKDRMHDATRERMQDSKTVRTEKCRKAEK